MTEKDKCGAQVNTPGVWSQTYRCQRNGSLFEEGKYWCKTHAPSSVKARRNATNARYDLESAKQHNEWHKNAEGRKAIELLRQIAEDRLTVGIHQEAKAFIEQYEKGLKNV